TVNACACPFSASPSKPRWISSLVGAATEDCAQAALWTDKSVDADRKKTRFFVARARGIFFPIFLFPQDQSLEILYLFHAPVPGLLPDMDREISFIIPGCPHRLAAFQPKDRAGSGNHWQSMRQPLRPDFAALHPASQNWLRGIFAPLMRSTGCSHQLF